MSASLVGLGDVYKRQFVQTQEDFGVMLSHPVGAGPLKPLFFHFAQTDVEARDALATQIRDEVVSMSAQ
eukprot:4948648-Alexandrium_andersonii.AAC.1